MLLLCSLNDVTAGVSLLISVAQLRVNRANGLFSEVTLPFEVEMAGRQGTVYDHPSHITFST